MLHSVLGRRNNGMAFILVIYFILLLLYVHAILVVVVKRSTRTRTRTLTHICCNRMRMRPYTEFSSVNCIRCINDKTGVDGNAIANCHRLFFASRNGFSGFMYSLHIHANRRAY